LSSRADGIQRLEDLRDGLLRGFEIATINASSDRGATPKSVPGDVLAMQSRVDGEPGSAIRLASL
jgi:hypothetical protein